MKPEIRIKQILEEAGREFNFDGPGEYYKMSKQDAIIKFLNEEWEKDKCEHKNAGRYVGGIIECLDCGYVGK